MRFKDKQAFHVVIDGEQATTIDEVHGALALSPEFRELERWQIGQIGRAFYLPVGHRVVDPWTLVLFEELDESTEPGEEPVVSEVVVTLYPLK